MLFLQYVFGPTQQYSMTESSITNCVMPRQFAFLILSKYTLPVGWALSMFKSGIGRFDSVQISFTFSSTVVETLSTNGTRLFSGKVSIYVVQFPRRWQFSQFPLKMTFILTRLINLTFYLIINFANFLFHFFLNWLTSTIALVVMH